MKNEIKFKEYLTTLCELHDKPMSKVLADIFWKILEPFPDDLCEKAFKEIIISNRFFPKPADFMEILQGKKENRATEAWILAFNTVRSVGNYESVKFADSAIHSVIEFMGGWSKFCMMSHEEVKWKQREFERLYDVMSAREAKHPEYLAGTHELENSRNGWNVKQEIVKIGYEKLKLIA